MGFLLLSILCSVSIANLLTWYNRDKQIDIYYIFAGNYLTASLFSWSTNQVPVIKAGGLEYGLGIAAGLLFLVNFLIYQKNIIKNGQSISVGIMRVSLIIPTLLSILIFSESLFYVKYLAIALIIAAFVRLSFTGHIRSLPLVLLLFTVTGITDSFMKIYDEKGLSDPSLYLAILFTSALFFTLLLIFVKKRSFNLKSILLGLMLGIPNQLTTKFFMNSLTSIPASIAYPLLASGVVLLAVVTDAGIWKRKFSGKAIFAYLMLLIGIVFLNIKW
ncbi:MAG: hypothetical protein K9M99_09760 [Candidatus Cloacimonetes bacterium]|nr:hypothetical protein [Candidatus Cloacimonadota bacterium]